MSPRIVQAGHAALRQRADLVDPSAISTKEMQALVRRMIDTMRRAPGVGLAAPQLGVSLRVIVLEDGEKLMGRLSPEERALRGRVTWPLTVLFNPEIEILGEERATFFEGCLSVEGWSALVTRALEVEVRGLGPEGEPVVHRASGWPARIFQHEIDHLDGTLYVDRMLSRTFGHNDEVSLRWSRRPVGETEAELDAHAPPPERPVRK
jgi:peptide deformylase